MSNKKMQEILRDLYLIDPSLKKEEEKIISIIEDIMENQPNIELNQDFVTQLKEKVFLEIESLENKNKFSIFSWQKLLYVSSASVLVILLSVLTVANFILPNEKKLKKDSDIIALNERAFGNLSISLEEGRNDLESSLSQSDDMVLGLGSAGESVIVSGDVSIMPYPVEQNNYKYVYNGEALDNLDLSSVSSLVYKRDNDDYFSRIFANNIKSISNLPIDLRNFTQTKLQHFNLEENKDYGYSVAVNLSNNSISIYSNWQYWPQPYKDCYDEICIENLRLNESDMLPDSELISIAQDFIDKYKINLDSYGPVEINKEAYKNNNYYPEQISLVYPLVINDKEVYSSHGGKNGLQISINIRERKVSSLNNLNFSNLKSSSYQLIDNTNRMNDLIERGGLNPDYYRSLQDNFIELELEEPVIALVKTWISSPDKNTSSELFIPSLIFKIKERPNEYFHRQNVIIPLVEEIYNDSLNNIDKPIPEYFDILPVRDMQMDMPRVDVEENDEGQFRIMPIQ